MRFIVQGHLQWQFHPQSEVFHSAFPKAEIVFVWAELHYKLHTVVAVMFQKCIHSSRSSAYTSDDALLKDADLDVMIKV